MMTTVNYVLTRRKMKSIRLRVVPPAGALKVSAPKGVPKYVIDEFVQSKEVWIEQQREQIKRMEPALEIDPLACRTKLDQRVPELLDYWQAKLGVQCTGWRTRQMKTRWGSCNISTGRINLNLVLGALDDSLLEYVVVHELVHLHERYHNKRFYAWLEKMLPDWRDREAGLRAVPLY